MVLIKVVTSLKTNSGDEMSYRKCRRVISVQRHLCRYDVRMPLLLCRKKPRGDFEYNLRDTYTEREVDRRSRKKNSVLLNESRNRSD